VLVGTPNSVSGTMTSVSGAGCGRSTNCSSPRELFSAYRRILSEM